MFKVGDKVICIDDVGGTYAAEDRLAKGKEYTVVSTSNGNFVDVLGENSLVARGTSIVRFKLTPKPMKLVTNPTALRTRFVPQTKPRTLRAGSLYKVTFAENGQVIVGRLLQKLNSKSLKEQFYALAAHGNPFVAKESEIALADKADVNSYLSNK